MVSTPGVTSLAVSVHCALLFKSASTFAFDVSEIP